MVVAHRYLVWDALNGDEEDARAVMAYCAQEAAVLFADLDSDGKADGLYFGCPHPISVKLPGGPTLRFDVSAETTHVMRAVQVRHD